MPVWGAHGLVVTSFRFLAPGEGEYARTRGMDPRWMARMLVDFADALDYCCSVSYSEERNLAENVPVPESQRPRVEVSTGSLLVDVLSEPTVWAGQALATLAYLTKRGPELVSLPQRIRERWYRDAAKAEQARQALTRLRAALPEEDRVDVLQINGGTGDEGSTAVDGE